MLGLNIEYMLTYHRDSGPWYVYKMLGSHAFAAS
jgi:hypothetical protein